METFFSWITFNGITPHIVVMCVISVCLIFMSAFMSGAETAFFSLSHNDVKIIKGQNTSSARAILNLLSNIDLLLATILVVNNLVNICIIILIASIIDAMFTIESYEFLLKTVLVTFLLLLFGEILPKVLAQMTSLRFANFVARPMVVIRWFFYPISYILVSTSSRISEKASRRSEISLNELADAVGLTKRTEAGHEMLSGIVNFGNTEVEEIMKSRVDITAVDITANYHIVKEIIILSGFSRIPIFEGDMDNIRGILYVKDILPFIDRDQSFDWQKLIRKPYFVPEHKKINDLLEEFQTNKVHMAIVVDEYGSTMGLVSFEDVIEEIVGEISDESDVEASFYTMIDSNTYIFDGKTHIGDFERVLELCEGLFDDVKGRAESLAGVVLELKGEFPKKGDVVVAHNIKLIVEQLESHRIDKIRVIING